MKSFINILTISLLLSPLCFGGSKVKKILDIPYDSGKVYILKTDGSTGPYTLFDKNNGLLTDLIKYERKLDEEDISELITVFNKVKKSDYGGADSRHVPLAMVFYKTSKPVLQVFPNFTGGDIYTRPKTKISGKYLVKSIYGYLAGYYFRTVKYFEMKKRFKSEK